MKLKELFKKKKEPIVIKIKTEIKKENIMFIEFYDKSNILVTLRPWDSNIIITPWIGFYKWYLCKNSPVYSLKTDDTYHVIKRSDIKLVTMKIREYKI